MTFIDAHVHIFPETALGRVNPRFGGEYAPYGFLKLPGGGGYHVMPPYIHDTQFTADTLVHMMDVYGVKQAVIQQSILNEQNAVVAEAVARYPHRLSGSMILEPGSNWQADLLHWKKAGLNSIKFEMRAFSMACPGVGYDHPWMRSMLELARQEDLAVVFAPAPTDFPVYRPEALFDALRALPGIRVVICHLGYPKPMDTAQSRSKWQEMVELAKLPGVWLDVSALPDLFEEEGWPYPTATAYLRQVKDWVGADKLIWGTDVPGTLCNATYPQMQRMFSIPGLFSQEEQQLLFSENARAAYCL